MQSVIDQAARCPVCEKVPVCSNETGLLGALVFFRCPQGHPYVACGDNLMAALANWNQYIMLRIEADTNQMIQKVKRGTNASYCRSCESFTPSRTTFEKHEDKGFVGYSVVIHECTSCKLPKLAKEVA